MPDHTVKYQSKLNSIFFHRNYGMIYDYFTLSKARHRFYPHKVETIFMGI